MWLDLEEDIAAEFAGRSVYSRRDSLSIRRPVASVVRRQGGLCTRCGRVPETNRSTCNACLKRPRNKAFESLARKLRRQDNAEREAEKQREWVEANRERRAELNRRYAELNREKRAAASRAWRAANRDRINERRAKTRPSRARTNVISEAAE